MLERYRADGRRLLVEALLNQPFVEGNAELASELAAVAVVEEAAPGQHLMQQDGSDNDLVLIISGSVSVLVNQRKVAERRTGQHVGEMALIDVAARRSATVVANVETVIARISESDFARIADRYPRIWRLLAVEIGNRLRERGQFVKLPNARPHVFIGSSREAHPIALALERMLAANDCGAVVRLWTNGVFEASKTTIESLEQVMATADFSVLVFSPDDHVFSRGTDYHAPRDNVIFELGLSIGALGRERSFIVLPRGADLKMPTDLLGLTPLTYEPGEPANLEARLHEPSAALVRIITRLGPK